MVGPIVPRPRVAASTRLDTAANGRNSANSRAGSMTSLVGAPAVAGGTRARPPPTRTATSTGARVAITTAATSSRSRSTSPMATNRTSPMSEPSVTTARAIRNSEVSVKTMPTSALAKARAAMVMKARPPSPVITDASSPPAPPRASWRSSWLSLIDRWRSAAALGRRAMPGRRVARPTTPERLGPGGPGPGEPALEVVARGAAQNRPAGPSSGRPPTRDRPTVWSVPPPRTTTQSNCEVARSRTSSIRAVP